MRGFPYVIKEDSLWALTRPYHPSIWSDMDNMCFSTMKSEFKIMIVSRLVTTISESIRAIESFLVKLRGIVVLRTPKSGFLRLYCVLKVEQHLSSMYFTWSNFIYIHLLYLKTHFYGVRKTTKPCKTTRNYSMYPKHFQSFDIDPWIFDWGMRFIFRLSI